MFRGTAFGAFAVADHAAIDFSGDGVALSQCDDHFTQQPPF